MNNQILIEELTQTQAGLITESSTDGVNLWLTGTFMESGIRNRNGRVYPLQEIENAVVAGQRMITESKGIMGELDHPPTLSINLDRVSHIITELRIEGANAIGRAKILSTPMGNIAKELINSGVAIGVSSRGAGAVNESGGVTGFQFCTVDLVAQPSAPNAYPQSIQESLDHAKNGGVIVDLAESMRHDVAAQAYFKKEITKFLNTNIFMAK